jgi:hypothetical protein
MVFNSTVEVYGKGVPRSAGFLTKRKANKFLGFKFPISNIEDGGFLNRSADIEVIKAGLRQLLLTRRGERVMLPNYGTNLKNYLMEPLDQATLSQIRREIVESFAKYAVGVKLLKIQVFPSDSPSLSGGHFLYVNLFCSIKEEDTVSFEVKVEIA